jgi:putative ABC transport system ATP-binding protein
MSDAPILQMVDVVRVHGRGDTAVRALDGPSLTVRRGELVAVTGPSGSGKSTLLNLAGGLDGPTSGVVSVEGQRLAGMSSAELARLRRRSVGYVFQDYNLVPSLTALENVALPLELDGVRAGVAWPQARHALDEVGIAELAGRFPHELSGGQQQRTAIARAVIGTRSLVLADEPTGALDTNTGEQILRILRSRCEAGAAALLVTHEARHAAWADRIIYLRDGRIIGEAAADSPDALLMDVP